MGKSQGNLTQEFWIRLGVSLAIFTAIMFLIIPRIAKWFFRKLESEKHSHYIFVLSVVFFAAFLAEVAGVEPIIGAFVAGLALNKLIPHSSALMNRIEFIGNSLFIPFFLISVGMIVNISVILKGPMALIVAGTLTLIAIVGKWLAAFITQLVFKYSKAQRNLIFGLSSAHAAATLAIILVGYEAGILDENILNGTVILILITCIIASFAAENAAKEIVIESEDNAAELLKEKIQSEHILIPIENALNVEKTLEFVTLIKNKKSANPVSVLTVVSNDEEAEVNILKNRNKLEEFVKQAAASETKVNIITTIDHNAASGISRISREIMADIIILEWPRQTGFIDKLIGEKIDSILNNTDKSLFISYFKKPIVLNKRILVAVPPFAEYENGFGLWLTKIAILAQELSISVQIYSNASTMKSIERFSKQAKLTAPISYHTFIDWDDFLVLSRNINEDDLLVLVSARKGATSYMGALDKIPAKLDKYFASNNRLIIYPQQYNSDAMIEQYNDFSAEPLNKSIEAVQKISKGIGTIFKGKK